MRVREALVCREPHAGRAARAARRRKNGERGKKLKVSTQNRRKKLKAAPAPARLKMLKVTDHLQKPNPDPKVDPRPRATLLTCLRPTPLLYPLWVERTS